MQKKKVGKKGCTGWGFSMESQQEGNDNLTERKKRSETTRIARSGFNGVETGD